MFLKSKFGVGINLTVVKIENATTESTDLIEEMLKNYASSVHRVASIESTQNKDNCEEIVFNLSQDFEQHYHEFFLYFDNNKVELEVKSYGVGNTSLEQVFLNVAAQAEKSQKAINTIQAEQVNDLPQPRQS